MNCQRVSAEDMVERYLLDGLSEADREAFEEHYFECDQCFANVEAVRAVKVRLEREQESVPRLAQRPSSTIRWWWWALVAAACVTLGVTAVVWWTAATVPPMTAELSSELAQMARIDPPYYEAIRLRGVYDHAQPVSYTHLRAHET